MVKGARWWCAHGVVQHSTTHLIPKCLIVSALFLSPVKEWGQKEMRDGELES